MRDEQDAIAARGARLAVIGNGTAAQARALREDLGYAGPLLVDPERIAYRAAGLRRGAGRALSWRTFGHAVRAWRGDHRQRGVQGDPWQLGGVFVVTPRGDVPYARPSREAGDHAPVREILAALDGLGAAR